MTSTRDLQIAARYDSKAEAEVLGWLKQLVQADIEPGSSSVENALRDGQTLIK